MQRATPPDPDQIVRSMGFPDSERGRYVTELRASVARQVAAGLVSRSAGTWAPAASQLTYEQRAKAVLAADWAVANGNAYRVECLDPVVYRQHDLRTGRSRLVVHWGSVPAKLRDLARKWRCKLTAPFRPRNPYA